MKELKRGIIASIQGYTFNTITELAREALSAGIVGLRTDKKLVLSDAECLVPIVGLHKVKVADVKIMAHITPDVATIKNVSPWCDLVAVDYRRCNVALPEVSSYCRSNDLHVVADIECFEDFENLRDNGYYYDFVATTFSVFRSLFRPNLRLVERIVKEEKHLIAEGNFSSRKDVFDAFRAGAHAVCIGSAISNVYKLTKKYTSITI